MKNSVKSKNYSLSFFSGKPITMTSIEGGLTGLQAFIGFGNAVSKKVIKKSTLLHLAYTAENNCKIKEINAVFKNNSPLFLLDTSVYVVFQIYSSENGKSFSKLENSLCILNPLYSGIFIPSTTVVSKKRSDLNIDLKKDTKIIICFSIFSAGETLLNKISGFANAEITFEE